MGRSDGLRNADSAREYTAREYTAREYTAREYTGGGAGFMRRGIWM
jgi:hypothetical protein